VAKTPDRKKRRRTIIAIVAVSLAVVVLVLAVVVKRVVANKIAEAAEKRALVIDYASSSFWFSRVTLTDTVIRPKATDKIKITAPTLTAKIAALRPYYVEIPRVEITMSGTVEEVLASLGAVRDADAKIPPEDRMPIDVQTGSFNWEKPLGNKSSIYFSRVTLAVRPIEGQVHAELGNGKIEGPRFSFSPLALTLDRKRTGAAVKLAAVLDPQGAGELRLDATRGPDGDTAELTLKDFAPRSLHLKDVFFDVAKTTVDGTASLSRSSEGAVRSNGKLVLDHLDLPPIKLGPITAAFGADARIFWKGTPKKGSPGTMTLDDTRIEIVIRGKTRVLKITGEVSLGEKGEGPFLVDARYDLGPIPCGEIASGVGGLAGQLVSGSIIGNVSINGTIKGDLAAMDKAKTTASFSQNCGIDTPTLKLPF